MKKGLSVLGILAVLTAVALPPSLGAEGVKVQPEGAEKGQKRKRPEGKREGNREGDPFSKSVAFGDDLGKVDSAVGLNDEQKKKLQDLKEQRDKALEKYDQTYQKRIAKAEAAMEKLHGKKDREAGQVRKDVEGFLKSVQTNRAKLAEGYERRMFAVLTPEQHHQVELADTDRGDDERVLAAVPRRQAGGAAPGALRGPGQAVEHPPGPREAREVPRPDQEAGVQDHPYQEAAGRVPEAQGAHEDHRQGPGRQGQAQGLTEG